MAKNTQKNKRFEYSILESEYSAEYRVNSDRVLESEYLRLLGPRRALNVIQLQEFSGEGIADVLFVKADPETCTLYLCDIYHGNVIESHDSDHQVNT